MSTGVLLGVAGCIAIVAIYFLWARKLGNKPAATQEQPAAKTPDAPKA
jgi:hypothetical protein